MPSSSESEDTLGTQDAASELVGQLQDQIEPLLPLDSLDELVERLESLEVGSRRVPTKALAPHVDPALFPVRDADGLRDALAAGVERAVQLGRSTSFSGRFEVLDQVVGRVAGHDSRAGLQIPASWWQFHSRPPVARPPREPDGAL